MKKMFLLLFSIYTTISRLIFYLAYDESYLTYYCESNYITISLEWNKYICTLLGIWMDGILHPLQVGGGDCKTYFKGLFYKVLKWAWTILSKNLSEETNKN